METGTITRVITLAAGILAAWLVADTLSTAITTLTGLKGAAGMILGFIIYAVIFFAVLGLLEKYAHITFFRFDRE
jgi:hypothetical protein